MSKKISKSNYQLKMLRVTEFISHNLDEKLTLDQLSQVAGFSKFHFNRQFSAYVGIATFRYIQLMRLRRASYQLAFNQEKKIIDIALDAQFSNHESFSRAFNKLYGQSPSVFRSSPDWGQWQQKFGLPIEFNPFEQKTEKTLMNVEINQFKTTRIAKLQHRGSPQLVLQSASKFIKWRKETKLSPVKTSNTYGVAYDDPRITAAAEFRFDICGSIESDVPENDYGVVSGEIPGGRCAVIRHYGSHDLMESKVSYLYREWLPASGELLRDFPCYFHYLNLIPEVEEHQLVTDIYLPIK